MTGRRFQGKKDKTYLRLRDTPAAQTAPSRSVITYTQYLSLLYVARESVDAVMHVVEKLAKEQRNSRVYATEQRWLAAAKATLDEQLRAAGCSNINSRQVAGSSGSRSITGVRRKRKLCTLYTIA
jgi:hypothetical protein